MKFLAYRSHFDPNPVDVIEFCLSLLTLASDRFCFEFGKHRAKSKVGFDHLRLNSGQSWDDFDKYRPMLA